MLSPEEFTQHFHLRLIQYLKASYPEANQLLAAIEYSMQSPGKRLRPRFVTEAARQVNLAPEITELTEFAIEMAHLFSLVHDDLPCLDNDDFRRGLPTTHKKFGEAQALLAGDALLSMALETLAKTSTQVTPIAFQNAFLFFTHCIGPTGMIGGQSLELEMNEPTLEQLLKIQSLKTTELFKAAILTPLLLSGVKKTDALFIENMVYAEAFGFAFQIADDLEDEEQDALQKKKNILSQMGRESAISLALRQLQSQKCAQNFSATEFLVKKLSSPRKT